MGWDVVAQVSWFAGRCRLHQLVQFADLRLQQVYLLLLAKNCAIEFFQVVFAKAKLDFEFADPGVHAYSSVRH